MKKDGNVEAGELAWKILAAVGPKWNIKSLTNCMTRLRLELVREDAEKIDALKGAEGVLGINHSGEELQIVLGPGRVQKVRKVLDELLAKTADEGGSADTVGGKNDISNVGADDNAVSDISNSNGKTDDKGLNAKTNNDGDNVESGSINPASTSSDAPTQPQPTQKKRHVIGDGKELHAEIRAKNATPVKLFLRKIAAAFLPLIPGFIACGLITGVLGAMAKVDPALTASPIYQLAALAGGTVFFGMYLLVARNAAQVFGGSPVLGAMAGALLSLPALGDITLFGETLVPQRGGVIAVLFAGIFSALVEQRVRRYVPEVLDLFLTPLITFLITATAAIVVIQPIGGIVADGIGIAATTLVQSGGAFAGFFLGAIWLPVVMLGVHQAFTPIHAQLLAEYGVTILLPILAMAGAGQVGASIAVYTMTRNEKLKKIIASALPVGFLGIGEPLIYGVTLPLVRPFIGACIGGACGGALEATFVVGATAFGISGLPLAMATDNIPIYLLGLITAYIAGFVATRLIGFDDPID